MVRIVDLIRQFRQEPTVMNNGREFAYLKLLSKLDVEDICRNKKEFLELLDGLVYSYRENYLEESEESQEFLDWLGRVESLVDDRDLRVRLIFVLEEFSNDRDRARERIRSEVGRRIFDS